LENRQHIGRILAEALLQGKSVYLDEIGILAPRRKAAFREVQGEVTEWHPPSVSLEFEPAKAK
jgi:hypothetical protein